MADKNQLMLNVICTNCTNSECAFTLIMWRSTLPLSTCESITINYIGHGLSELVVDGFKLGALFTVKSQTLK